MHNKHQIENVLPHDHPMILLDELLSYSDVGARCAVTIKQSSHFFNSQSQSVPSYVGIEYMAQTIAAYANANAVDEGHEVSVGFLVSSRKYEVSSGSFDLGDTLYIEVEKVLQNENGLSVFECKISSSDQVKVTASINVFQPDNPEAFLAEQYQS